MSFMDNLKETLDNRKQFTENGAIGYSTTGKNLLDINFAVASLRNQSDQKIINKFVDAFYEDKLIAVKWLFYARDIRGGLGERRLFRVCMRYLDQNNPDIAKAVIELIPEYGRWDDMFFILTSTTLCDYGMQIIKNQLEQDMRNAKENKPISLLAKWLPSWKSANAEKRNMAKIIVKHLGITEREYTKMLVELRKYLDIVEVKMCAQNWNEIKYPAVPSRANLRYNKAFLKHDELRRREYLASLEKGEAKINAGTLFPHDIVHQYVENDRHCRPKSTEDVTLEQLWKALPDYVKGAGNTIVVADGSGSMSIKVGGTNVSALEVANSLAIYFAERSSGQFKDNYITFSSRPQLVDFSKAKNLREKLEIASRHNEIADTNIEAVFDLILRTAINKNMTQEEIPQSVLILSDMEFNSCVRCNSGRPNATLFENIAARYEQHGYKLPRLVFWNLNSRTGTIPVKQNELGVSLVSGFSPAIAKMVLSNKTDPFECLLEQINSERYEPVEKALKGVI